MTNHTYSYSRLGFEEFFSLRKQRLSGIFDYDQLEQKNDQVKIEIVRGIQNWTRLQNSVGDILIFELEQILFSMFEINRESSCSISYQAEIIFRLQKQFEISSTLQNRLISQRRKSVSEVVESHSLRFSYPLLSIALGKSFQKEENYSLLSTSLKINDLIWSSSVLEERVSSGLLKAALSLERTNLMKSFSLSS